MASFIADEEQKKLVYEKYWVHLYLIYGIIKSKDFVLLVFISFFIASPIAYYFMTMAAELSVQNKFIVVDFCYRHWCIDDHINNGKLSGDKSGDSKPVEEFENGMRNESG